MDKDKIRNGGMYLVNLSGSVNPEFGLKHYCVLVNTHDKDLFLAFPTTTSEKRNNERWTKVLTIDNSIVLLKHVRIISKRRIICEATTNGVLNVLNEDELDSLLSEYEEFIHYAHQKANLSVKQYHDHRQKSFDNLSLECVSSVEIKVGELIDYNSLVTKASGGNVVHNNISTKTTGEKIITYILKDKYNQKIEKDVKVIINEEIQEDEVNTESEVS